MSGKSKPNSKIFVSKADRFESCKKNQQSCDTQESLEPRLRMKANSYAPGVVIHIPRLTHLPC